MTLEIIQAKQKQAEERYKVVTGAIGQLKAQLEQLSNEQQQLVGALMTLQGLEQELQETKDASGTGSAGGPVT